MFPRPAVLACALALFPATASADTITVNLKGSDTSAAIAGTVAVSGGGGSSATTAGSDGVATILVPPGTYNVSAGATGYAVGTQTGVASGATVELTLTSSGTKFTPLPVFGGANGGLYADGQPGVFYAQSTQIPQLYRTTNYGASWQPITVRFDDAFNGIPGTSNIGSVLSATTSGFPGEVAAFVGNTVYFSTNYGISWRSVASTPGGGFPELQWGHAGSDSILVASVGGHQYLADLNAITPAFTQMATDFTADAGSVMRVANGDNKPWVAVARTTGTVSIYALTTGGTPGSVVATATGFPTAPRSVAFGGLSSPTGPPSGIAVSDDDEVAMTVKEESAGTYAAAALISAAGGSACVAFPGIGGAVGGVTGDSGSFADVGMAQIGRCWLKLTPSALTSAIVSGGGGFAIDRGFGIAGQVTFVGGSRGPVKSASLDGSGVPLFDETATATSGSGAGTGGSSINGITAPTVEGQTFGPTAPDQQATILHGGFGGVGYASGDGGVTVKVATNKGGWAVDWWQGVTHKWLAFGTPGNSGNVLSIQEDWTSASSAVNPNAGVQATMVAGSAVNATEAFATAMAGVPGTDTLFVALSDSNGFSDDSDGTLRRVTVSSGPSVSAPTTIGAGQITRAIHELAYCPTAGSAASLADVLLVATGNFPNGGALTTGGLWRVTGATTGSPVATQIATVPNNHIVLDVKASCADGTVFAGTGANPSDLFKSTDGGVTFSAVTSYGSGDVRAIGINAGSPNEVFASVGTEGKLIRSIDTGATWAVVNDPATGHNFSGDGVVDILVPPSATAVTSLRNRQLFSGLTTRSVLVAGSGAYSVLARPAPSTGGGGGGGGGGDTTPPATTPPATTPPVTTPPVVTRDTTRPTITGLGLTKSRFKAGTKSPFKLTLSEPATVVITIAQKTQGYKKGKKCVKAKPAGKPKRCTLYVSKGKATGPLAAGLASIPFTGKVSGATLKPGSYRATAVATDAAGNRSAPVTATFTVLKK